MRYVTMRRPRMYTTDDMPMLEAKTVHEPDPIDTGIVDQYESPIFRVMSPVGFVEMKERLR